MRTSSHDFLILPDLPFFPHSSVEGRDRTFFPFHMVGLPGVIPQVQLHPHCNNPDAQTVPARFLLCKQQNTTKAPKCSGSKNILVYYLFLCFLKKNPPVTPDRHLPFPRECHHQSAGVKCLLRRPRVCVYQIQDGFTAPGPNLSVSYKQPGTFPLLSNENDYLNVTEGLGSREAVNKNYDEKVYP